MKRTIYCGELREALVGSEQTCCGWVQTVRDMGGVIFVDLHDREGTLQAVFDLERLGSEQFAVAEGLKVQSVIAVRGTVRLRDAETVNPLLATGTVELAALSLEVLSQAETVPFSPDGDASVREDLRLQYRYLDLRRPSLQANLRFRHRLQRCAEEYLDAQGFTCVETPMLCKSTPEGARDYLVPSRVHPGSFYALPQSPQIYKQLLMVGGMDRYYQVARCFRDEDLRADRQPEFTQVDMELSFVDQEDILQHLEAMFKHIFRTCMGREIEGSFPRLTWQTAMDVYGSDKPDLRFGLPIVDITPVAKKCSFSVFRSIADNGGVIRAINVKGKADFTRTQIEELTASAVRLGAKGMAWIAVRPDGELYSVLTKYFKEEELQEILKVCEAKPGDFLLFCADKLPTVRRVLGGLRNELGGMLGLKDKQDFRFLFVTDFPQFEWSEDEKRYVASHHPFTMPYEEDVQYLLTAPEKVRAQAYDVVLNGVELGSGSIRIHRRDVQEKMFAALGFGKEQIEERFGFMVNAFRYGVPPHGGFAFGLDRLVMLLCGADSLREVIAFPKVKDASCPMTQAPTPVDDAQLAVLGLLGGAWVHAERERTAARKKPTVEVEYVAALSRLRLTEEERASLPDEMEAIIGFANRLSAVDTSGTPETAHAGDLQNIWREDQVAPSFPRDLLLENAPTGEDGYITVPRVVEE
ncbi:MAG: aspartate--tRNA ligase [Oscillospiraceae bacterium]|nr:aspartate--tRNA ligase [Oscillospiraceae bacterium]